MSHKNIKQTTKIVLASRKNEDIICFFFVWLEGRTDFYEGASEDIAPPPKDIHGHGHEYPSYHDVIVVNKLTPNS